MSAPGTLVDRIMAAVRDEAQPTPTRAFAMAVRHARVGDALASVAVAWHLVTVRRPAVGSSIRARSLALVIAVWLSIGSFSIVAGAAARAVVEQAVFGVGVGDGHPGPDLQRPAPDSSESVDHGAGATEAPGEVPASPSPSGRGSGEVEPTTVPGSPGDDPAADEGEPVDEDDGAVDGHDRGDSGESDTGEDGDDDEAPDDQVPDDEALDDEEPSGEPDDVEPGDSND